MNAGRRKYLRRIVGRVGACGDGLAGSAAGARRGDTDGSPSTQASGSAARLSPHPTSVARGQRTMMIERSFAQIESLGAGRWSTMAGGGVVSATIIGAAPFGQDEGWHRCPRPASADP